MTIPMLFDIRTERKHLETLCGWAKLSWKAVPPPVPEMIATAEA